jgi:mRNA interferase YafQ
LNRPSKRPLIPARTTAFEKDMARCKARGYDMDVLRVTMGRLINRQPLQRKQRDHGLKGEWAGYRECHLADNWLLVYRIEGDNIYFARTGTHTDLFQA